MDDRQIQQLVRMALEAEALESPESSGAFLLSAHRARRTGLRWGMAAAACLAFAGGLWGVLRSATPVPVQRPVAPVASAEVAKPDVPVLASAVPADPADHGVVLTIFRDSLGELSCVEWHSHEWGAGRDLSDLTARELVDAGTSLWCDAEASEMVVVALSGPPGSVPVTDDHALDLAACITGSDLCEQEPGTYASAALSCLPPGVQAVTHIVTLEQ